MDIQTLKIELAKVILNSDDVSFITKIEDFIKSAQPDSWNELSPGEQKEIKRGIEDLDKGKRIAYEDFLKKIS